MSEEEEEYHEEEFENEEEDKQEEEEQDKEDNQNDQDEKNEEDEDNHIDGEYDQSEVQEDEENQEVEDENLGILSLVASHDIAQQDNINSQLKGINNLKETTSVFQQSIVVKKQNKAPIKVKQPPKTNNKEPLKKPNLQGQMVKQMMQNHKDKQKKYKDLDDKIYIQEAVEKRLPKERPKIIVKQTLVFKKDVKQMLEDPNKNNQEKALILVNDLAQKIDKKPSSITEKDIPRRISIKQPAKDTEPKQRPKDPNFIVAIGAGIKNKLGEDAALSKKSDQARERPALLEQKKAEKKRLQMQLAQLESIREKEKQMVIDGQNNLKKENKVLMKEEVIKDKRPSDLQYESNQKEQQERSGIERKQLMLQLRHLKEESNDLGKALKFEQERNGAIEQEIVQLRKRPNVIENGGRFTSFGLAPKLTSQEAQVSMIDQFNSSMAGSI